MMEDALIFTDPELKAKHEEELRKQNNESKEYLILYIIDDENEPTDGFEFIQGRDNTIEYIRGIVDHYGNTLSLDESYVCVSTLSIDKRITLREFITIVNKEIEPLIPIEYDTEDEL